MLLTLNKSKKTNSKTPMGETGYLCILGAQLFCFCFFFNAQASSFLIHSHVPYGTSCHARGRQLSLLTLFFPPTLVIPHSSVDYRQFFKPILYFQSSPVQSDSRLYPIPLFYRECYGFERAFFYSQAFFTLHSLFLGKQRIFLGVTIILSMYLCLNTQLDCNQFTIIFRFVYIYMSIQ